MGLIATSNTPVTVLGPKRLLVYGPPKTGKSSSILELQKLLPEGEYNHIDLENSAYGFYEGRITNITSAKELMEFFKEAKETNFKSKVLVIDTITKLEDYAKVIALRDYKALPIGKTSTITDITTLPNGAGYGYLRTAMTNLLDKFASLCEYLIVIGHLKYTALNTEETEVIIKELALTGKLKDIVMAESDAIAYFYIDDKEPNNRYMSFIAQNSQIAGGRIAHLRNKKIKISELVNDNGKENIVANWELIYPEFK
jgi:predicted AAA+ superfamily ATPase